MSKLGAVDILVVEDNESQRESIVNVLEASISGVSVVAVVDGDDALDFLFARNEWADRSEEGPPKLILLDRDLPGTDAISILDQLRSGGPGDALKLIPVVIFTDSQSEVAARECYRYGANSYLVKPLGFPEFNSLVGMVAQYWVAHNRTPN